MTIRFGIIAAAGALAAGVLGASPGVPASAHVAVPAASGSALPSAADSYRQGFRKGLLDGDDAAEKECEYESTLDYEDHAERPAGIPADPAAVAVPAGHDENWVRGYREGFSHGW